MTNSILKPTSRTIKKVSIIETIEDNIQKVATLPEKPMEKPAETK